MPVKNIFHSVFCQQTVEGRRDEKQRQSGGRSCGERQTDAGHHIPDQQKQEIKRAKGRPRSKQGRGLKC